MNTTVTQKSFKIRLRDTRRTAIRAVKALIHLRNPAKVYLYETDVGVKYEFGGYIGDRFARHVEEEFPLASTSHGFEDLLIKHDFLRDRYTMCGLSLVQSPYVKLIADIVAGTLTEGSDYIKKCKAGTLDSRSPFTPSFAKLKKRCQSRLRELSTDQPFYVYAQRVTWKGKSAYVIVDGKHRVAVAAYLNRPEQMYIRLVSSSIAQEPFYEELYNYVLNLDSGEYSINQEMIRLICGGC